MGRFDEALSESERARQLDPLSLIIAADYGAILLFSRQYDRAIEQFRLRSSEGSEFWPGQRHLGSIRRKEDVYASAGPNRVMAPA